MAGSSIDLGNVGLQDTLSSIFEGTATSDGSFSLSLTPDFVFSNFSFQLDLKIKGSYETDPFSLDFDFSDWEPVEREDGQNDFDFFVAQVEQYSAFLRYAQWGQRYDKLYLRYGKLSGITIGDGALINGFFDTSVSVREAKPGLDFMIDGTLFNQPSMGFEFLTNDIFIPTLLAWRVFARPIYETNPEGYFADLELGLSYASNPSSTYPTEDGEDSDTVELNRKLLSLDFGIPLLPYDSMKMVFFTNLLVQSPDSLYNQPGLATRYGIWGHWTSIFVFNTSITIPHFGTYFADYFDSGFDDKTYLELEESVVALGTTRLDTQIALNFSNKGAYLTTRIRSDYAEGEFSNYRFLATARIDKRLFNIVSLDLSYEKLYPTSTGEGFFEGLSTFRNVEIGATTIISAKPYSFDIGLSMIFDDEAEYTLQVETVVKISIF
jgi:hypothetical protein